MYSLRYIVWCQFCQMHFPFFVCRLRNSDRLVWCAGWATGGAGWGRVRVRAVVLHAGQDPFLVSVSVLTHRVMI